MSLQGAICALEMGTGKRIVQGVTLIIGFAAVLGWYDISQFRGFNSIEAMDAAQIGREISRGHGFTTQYIRPLAIDQIRHFHDAKSHGAATPYKPDLLKFPDISNAPFYPVVLGALFKAGFVDFDVSFKAMRTSMGYSPERLVVALNQICFLLTGGLMYWLGLRLFDQRVAMLGVASYIVCNLVWEFSISGLSTSLLLLLLTGVLVALNEAIIAQDEGLRLRVWIFLFSSAVLMALAILTRLLLGWLFLPYAGLLFIAFRKRLAPAIIAIMLVLAGVTPWLVRDYNVCGSIVGTSIYLLPSQQDYGTSYEVEREQVPKDSPWLRAALHKLISGVANSFHQWFDMTGSTLGALLFVASLLHRFKRRRAQWLKNFIWLSLVFLVIGSSLFMAAPEPSSSGNNMVLFLPGILLFGSAFFFVLLDRMEVPFQMIRYGVVALWLVLSAIPLAATLIPSPGPNFHYPPYHPLIFKLVADWYKPGEILVSDIAWAFAWYGDRVTVLLPDSVTHYVELNDKIAPPVGVMISRVTYDRPLYEIEKGPYKEWAPIVRRQVPKDFPLQAVTALPPDGDFFLISDFPRWSFAPKPEE